MGESNDFLDYTEEWISKVNRGGLFPLNDETFRLFIEIEKQVRIVLSEYMLSKTREEDVIIKVVEDENVQFQWILISQCRKMLVQRSKEILCLILAYTISNLIFSKT